MNYHEYVKILNWEMLILNDNNLVLFHNFVFLSVLWLGNGKKYWSERRVVKKRSGWFGGLQEETVQGMLSVIFAVIAVFLILSAFGKAGLVGNKTYSFLHFLFGTGFFLFPLLLIILSISSFRSFKKKFDTWKFLGSIGFFISGLGLVEIASPGRGALRARPSLLQPFPFLILTSA